MLTACLCLLLVSTATSSSTANGSQISTLHFLVLLPFPLGSNDSSVQPSVSDGPSILPAVQLAQEEINARRDVLADYNVEILVRNSACDIGTYTLRSFVEPVFHGEQNITGVIGPGCSFSSLVAAAQLSRKEVALLNFHIASSSTLSNRERYGYSFGVVGSLQAYVNTIVSLLRYNSWNSVVILYDESRAFYSLIHDKLSSELSRDSNLTADFSSPLFHDFIPLSRIPNLPNKPRVVILLMSYEYAQRIMCLALRDHPNLLYPSYQFIMVETVTGMDLGVQNVDFSFQNKRYNCSAEAVQTALEGSIHLHFRLRPESDETVIVSGTNYSDYWKKYSSRAAEGNVTATEWANTYYDAMWAFALALNRSLSKIASPLTSYRFRQHDTTDIIRDEVLELMFQGASGWIEFDQGSGYISRVVNIFQVMEHRAVKVGYFLDDKNFEIQEEAEFIENSFEMVELKIPTYLAILLILLSLIGFVLLIILQVLTIAYRNYKSVKATSPRLTHLIYVGCYLLTVAAITTILLQALPSSHVHYPFMCTLDLWALLCGLTLVLATVCAKTWRLYRIFVHYLDPGQWLSDKVLLVYILVVTGISVALCLSWSVASPLRKEEIRSTDGNKINVQAQCTSNFFFEWYGAALGYITIIMTFTVILAILTRGVKHTYFRTKAVILFIYALAILLGIGIPISVILTVENTHSYAPYVVHMLTVDLIVCICIALLFLPPLTPLLKEKHSSVCHTCSNVYVGVGAV